MGKFIIYFSLGWFISCFILSKSLQMYATEFATCVVILISWKSLDGISRRLPEMRGKTLLVLLIKLLILLYMFQIILNVIDDSLFYMYNDKKINGFKSLILWLPTQPSDYFPKSGGLYDVKVCKSSYKKCALKFHPDKGGTNDNLRLCTALKEMCEEVCFFDLCFKFYS